MGASFSRKDLCNTRQMHSLPFADYFLVHFNNLFPEFLSSSRALFRSLTYFLLPARHTDTPRHGHAQSPRYTVLDEFRLVVFSRVLCLCFPLNYRCPLPDTKMLTHVLTFASARAFGTGFHLISAELSF